MVVEKPQTVSPLLEGDLGRALRVADMARFLGVDEKTVRRYYTELGGVRLGRLIVFFEKEVVNAIQKRSKMASPSAIEWQEEGEGLPEQEGGVGMGERGQVKSRGDLASADRHGILV